MADEAPPPPPAVAAPEAAPAKANKLVWAKQASMPWWPAELVTDYTDVSPSVLGYKHPAHHVLVWLFEATPPRSYAWVDPGPSALLPFRSPGFAQRSKPPKRDTENLAGALELVLAVEKERGGPTAEELALSEQGPAPKAKAAAKKRQRARSDDEAEAVSGEEDLDKAERKSEARQSARESREARAKKGEARPQGRSSRERTLLVVQQRASRKRWRCDHGS